MLKKNSQDILSSINELLKTETQILEVARLLNEKGLLLAGMGEWKNSVEAYEASIKIYKDINNHYMAKNVRLNMATALRNLGMFDAAAEIYHEELSNFIPIKVDEKLEWAKAQNDYGVVLTKLQDWVNANSVFDTAYNIFIEVGYDIGVGTVWQNRANLAILKGDYEDAIIALEKAQVLFQSCNNTLGFAEVIAGMGLVFKKQGKLNDALQLFVQANILFEDLGHLDNLAKGYGNIGAILEQQKDYSHSIEFYEKAQELFKKLSNEFDEALVVANLGKVWANLDIARSNELLKAAIVTLRRLGADGEANIVMKWLVYNMT